MHTKTKLKSHSEISLTGKGSRIAYWLKDVSVFNKEDWDKMISFMTTNMIKFEKSIKDVLRDVIKK